MNLTTLQQFKSGIRGEVVDRDVIRAVQFARSQNLPAALRGGGHGSHGYSVCDDGIVIDLSQMKGISIDPVISLRCSSGAASIQCALTMIE